MSAEASQAVRDERLGTMLEGGMMQAEILVVGLGNRWRGDDAAGVLACRALARRWQRCGSAWSDRGASWSQPGQPQPAARGSAGVRLRFLTELLDPLTLAAELMAAEISACLVLDAVMAGLPPGELVRWELGGGEGEGGAEGDQGYGLVAMGSDMALAVPDPVTSLHGIGVVAAWHLVKATTCCTVLAKPPGNVSDGSRCSRIVVWAIQADPGCLWGNRLSPAVALGLRPFVEAAWGELCTMAGLADGRGDCLTGERARDSAGDLKDA